MPQTLHDLERADLQDDIPSSINSIHDLRELYYKNKLGFGASADRHEKEIIRSFLISQTGAVSVFSLYDLWVLYLVQQGVTQRLSLSDMLREYMGSSTLELPPDLQTGLLVGFPFGMTYT